MRPTRSEAARPSVSHSARLTWRSRPSAPARAMPIGASSNVARSSSSRAAIARPRSKSSTKTSTFERSTMASKGLKM